MNVGPRIVGFSTCLADNHELLALHKVLRLDAVDIDPACKSCSIQHRRVSSRSICGIHKCRDLLSKDVSDHECYMTLADLCPRYLRLGTSLQESQAESSLKLRGQCVESTMKQPTGLPKVHRITLCPGDTVPPHAGQSSCTGSGYVLNDPSSA